jgi:hypothetical protein
MENIVQPPTIPATHCVSMRGRITRIESDRGNLCVKGFSGEERWTVETGTPVYRCNRMISVRDLLPGDIVTVLGCYSNHRLHARSIRLHFPVLKAFHGNAKGESSQENGGIYQWSRERKVGFRKSSTGVLH